MANDNNSPPRDQLKTGPRGGRGLGWNDSAGIVHCALCDWSKDCGPNMERIEHELRQHLEAAHGRRLLYRVDDLDGHVVEIPE